MAKAPEPTLLFPALADSISPRGMGMWRGLHSASASVSHINLAALVSCRSKQKSDFKGKGKRDRRSQKWHQYVDWHFFGESHWFFFLHATTSYWYLKKQFSDKHVRYKVVHFRPVLRIQTIFNTDPAFHFDTDPDPYCFKEETYLISTFY